MSLYVDLSTLIVGIGLIFVGIILLKRWSSEYKDLYFYWGFGLCLWGVSHASKFFTSMGILTTTHTVVFIQLFLTGIGFTFFLLYGTLILILRKKQANIIVLIYFFAFFVANILLAGMTESAVVLSVWHNILFITPPALVFGIYYFYHYRREKKREIWLMYNIWILFALLAYTYTFLYSLGIATDTAMTLWQSGQNITIAVLAYTYLIFLFKEKETWNIVTKTVDYVVDDELKEFFQEYFFDRATNIIIQVMKQLNLTHIRTATKEDRETFIETAIKDHFAKIISLQRQEVVRAKLLSILDVRLDMRESGNYGIDLGN